MFAQWLILSCRVTSKGVVFAFATMSCGMFAQWLILFCCVPSNVVVSVFELTQSVATSCHRNAWMNSRQPSLKYPLGLPMQVTTAYIGDWYHECVISKWCTEILTICPRWCIRPLPDATFGLNVLLLPACVCACVYVPVTHELVLAITCVPFNPSLPNLDQRSKTP